MGIFNQLHLFSWSIGIPVFLIVVLHWLFSYFVFCYCCGILQVNWKAKIYLEICSFSYGYFCVAQTFKVRFTFEESLLLAVIETPLLCEGCGAFTKIIQSDATWIKGLKLFFFTGIQCILCTYGTSLNNDACRYDRKQNSGAKVAV